MGSFGFWHWLIFAGILLWLWRAVTRRDRPRPAPPPAASDGSRFAKIRGDGRFATEVVGESFYAEAFEALYRAHRVGDREDEWFGDALLRLESDNPHDSNAVGVYLEGCKVGHLNRQTAREFRQAIVRDGIAGRNEYAVAARVYWGGADRTHSVTLDLPQT